MRIVVHDSSFHADDVFAVASLLRLYPEAEVIRSRDPEIIASGDIVADVGSVYDPSKNRFDHHQKGGAGARENGIPYASVGLVWKKFGAEIAGSSEVAAIVDRRLIAAVDGPDNGVALAAPSFKETWPYHPGLMVEAFNPTWKETKDDTYPLFRRAVEVAGAILEREIVYARAAVEGYRKVHEAYARAEDKRIVLLDAAHYPWRDSITEHPEVLYVVMPEERGHWKVRTVDKEVFIARKPLPAAWAGLSDTELAAASGVPDATFCHNKRFIAVARSKEGALALARIATDA